MYIFLLYSKLFKTMLIRILTSLSKSNGWFMLIIKGFESLVLDKIAKLVHDEISIEHAVLQEDVKKHHK